MCEATYGTLATRVRVGIVVDAQSMAGAKRMNTTRVQFVVFSRAKTAETGAAQKTSCERHLLVVGFFLQNYHSFFGFKVTPPLRARNAIAGGRGMKIDMNRLTRSPVAAEAEADG